MLVRRNLCSPKMLKTVYNTASGVLSSYPTLSVSDTWARALPDEITTNIVSADMANCESSPGSI